MRHTTTSRSSRRQRARLRARSTPVWSRGITELTFWGYQHNEKLQIAQVPYRDVNLAPVDLSEGRIQVVMSALAIVQPQWRADRIKLIALNNKTRTLLVPGIPTALEEGYPSLVFEGLHGLIGLRTCRRTSRSVTAPVL